MENSNATKKRPRDPINDDDLIETSLPKKSPKLAADDTPRTLFNSTEEKVSKTVCFIDHLASSLVETEEKLTHGFFSFNFDFVLTECCRIYNNVWTS
jgi:hypothetical protein